MKRYFALAVLISALLFLLGGCGFWMDGEYVYVEPYEQLGSSGSKEVISVTTYMQLRNALTELVEQGAEGGVLSVENFNGASVHFYVDTAIRYVMTNTPMGAYAVEDITYEIGTNAGKAAIALEIFYRYDRSHILRIVESKDMEDMFAVIGDALAECMPYIVVRVPSFENTDIVQWVSDYSARNPDIVMELPAVESSVYPLKGEDRIVEIVFTYQTSRDSLRNMQKTVEPVFTAAELYVKNATQVREKYAQLYAFLMERTEYKMETSITPAYSLLNHGVGDCKAFANVYAAMCRKADLECYVISGTRDGAPWSWNLINFRGNYYHLDLLRSAQSGSFQPQTASALSGYVWDYSAYPD